MGPGPTQGPRAGKAWDSPTRGSGSRRSMAATRASVSGPARRVARWRPCACPTGAWGRSGVADIRALIVDDEPLARRGIRQLLAAYPDITVVGECRDGREALRALTT